MMLLPFKRAASSGWRPDELAECFRVVDLLARAGLTVSIQTGVSDEGEPWGVVVRDDTGDILLHLARTDGQFLVASASGTPAQRGRTLREVINAAFSNGELAFASQRARLRDDGVLRLHPSALMAAFIVTAWLHTETGREMHAAGRPDRSETGGGSTGTVRYGSDAAHGSYPTVLMKAAVSLAAVAAVLETSSNVWVPLELDIDGLVALAAAPQLILSGSSLSYAGMDANAGTRWPVNFEALENILVDTPAHTPTRSEFSFDVASAEAGLPVAQTTPSNNTSPNFVVLPASTAASVVPLWSSSVLDSPSLSLAFPERNTISTSPSGVDHGVPVVVALLSSTMDSSFSHAAPQNSATASFSAPARSSAPVSQPLAASISTSAVTVDSAVSVVRQTSSVAQFVPPVPVASAESVTSLNSGSLSVSEASPFFRTALQLLHMDQGFLTEGRSFGSVNFLSFSNINNSASLGTFKSSWSTYGTSNESLAASNTANLSEDRSTAAIVPEAAVEPALAVAPTSTQRNVAQNDGFVSAAVLAAPAVDQPLISAAVPSVAAHVVTTPAVDQPLISAAVPSVAAPVATTPAVAAPAPPVSSVPYNTQLLLNFTADATHAAKGSMEARSVILAASQDTAGASRVVVFDAPWLSGKAFMLMPGVAMVENDLFADTARVALPSAAPVTLELGDGLSVQLLGLLTF